MIHEQYLTDTKHIVACGHIFTDEMTQVPKDH